MQLPSPVKVLHLQVVLEYEAFWRSLIFHAVHANAYHVLMS
jgi:hypothetical protein